VPSRATYIPAVPDATAAAVEPRILAVRFSSIGDILLTTPLLRALRARHPGARIDVVTRRPFRPLLADNPRIDTLYDLGPGERLATLAATLRTASYTHLLDLHGSLRSRTLRLLVPGPWRGYSKHRVARALLIRTKANRYPAGTPPVPERYFAAARGLDVHPDGGPPEFFLSAAAESEAAAWLASRGLGGRPLVAFAPGAAHATKRWPLEYWRDLARSLAMQGRDLVVVGAGGDAAVATEVAEAAGTQAASAAGEFGLQGTGALLRRAGVAVSGDTGVMHMATGVGTPVVALFGPTVSAFGFFPYAATATVLERDLPCRPCTRMGGPVCPLGHHDCLRTIPPHEVEAAVLALAGA
jgi:lipopolysaccharide heptosyltransferase II